MDAAAPAYEDRHGQILAELAGMGVTLARDLQQRALAAETVEEATQLAQAFHTISRSVRQSLALELKVIRFRGELAREAKATEAAQVHASAQRGSTRSPAVVLRFDAVARPIERLIYGEAEADEDESGEDESAEVEFDEARARALQVRLNQWLARAAERPDFLHADLDDLIIQACETLGLDPGRLYVFEDDPPTDDTSDPAAFASASDTS